MLGDNIFHGHGLTDTLRRADERADGATVFGYWVGDPERYGVAEFDASGKVVGIEEKPAQPRSNYAVTGLYFYDGRASEYAAGLKPSPRGELEITDLNKRYLDEGALYLEQLGRGYAWLDTGTHQSLHEASNFIQTMGPAGPPGQLPGGDRLRQRLDRRGAAGEAGRATGQERLRPVPAEPAPAGDRALKIVETSLPGCVVIEPAVFGDERGVFFETWNAERFGQHGLPVKFVQSNVSTSVKGVLRGLHYQWPRPQGKLVSVLEGEVYDVAVDIRRGSPTFGRWEAVVLSAENRRQFWIPEGFAHGFAVLSERAVFSYLCTDVYVKEADAGIRWNDGDIAVDWPVADPVLSGKDASAPLLADIPAGRLPAYPA